MKNGCFCPIPFVDLAGHARLAVQNADQLPVLRGAGIVSRKPLVHSAAHIVVERPAFCRRQRGPIPLDDVFGLL